MAQFKYTLPSGARFQLDAPSETTQAQADAIFYGQAAAGTFVDYEPGDTLSSPEQILSNFGLSRLERGTAGVDEKTLIAITLGLPVVAVLPPEVSTATVENPINIADYIKVSSNPVTGLIDQGPTDIGSLGRPEVQSVMAAGVVQAHNVLSMLGVGKYGFNCPQLIRTGYIKAQLESECAPDPVTQANPPNFIDFMNSPTPWTGKDGVISVDDILNNEALQNNIQERLMNQSYDTLVVTGLITPPTETTTIPVASEGQIYGSSGQMISTPAVERLTAPANASIADFGTITGTPSDAVANLGPQAMAIMEAGQSSLSTGAANFSGGQVSGLATAIGGFAAVTAAASLAARVSGDIGALLANGSKFGPALTSTWAQGSGLLSKVGSADFGKLAGTGITKLGDAASGAFKNLAGSAQAQLTAAIAGPVGAAMAALGKASQLATNLGAQLPGLVSKVEKAPAFTNTVDRKTVDAAVTRVIGSPKISSPTYEIPSAKSLGSIADIEQAKSILAQAGSSARELGNQAVAVVGQAQGAASNLTSQAQGAARNFFG